MSVGLHLVVVKSVEGDYTDEDLVYFTNGLSAMVNLHTLKIKINTSSKITNAGVDAIAKAMIPLKKLENLSFQVYWSTYTPALPDTINYYG